jgi:hypothetical protein
MMQRAPSPLLVERSAASAPLVQSPYACSGEAPKVIERTCP